MNVTVLKPFKRKNDEKGEFIDPMRHDLISMGYRIARNVTLLYETFPEEVAHYIIIVDNRTGERLKVEFSQPQSSPQAIP